MGEDFLRGEFLMARTASEFDAVVLVAMVASAGLAACTYNFDKFAEEHDAGLGAGGAAGSAIDTASMETQSGGRGGTPSAGGERTDVPSAAGGAAGSTSTADGAGGGPPMSDVGADRAGETGGTGGMGTGGALGDGGMAGGSGTVKR